MEAPSLVATGVQAVVEGASRLGLTWSLRLGTVTDAINKTVTLDGDTSAISAQFMGDMGWINGLRVFVIQVPEGACYVVGQALSNHASTSISFTPVANTPTSASVTWGRALPGTVHVTVSAESSVPGSQVHEVSMNQITATGCTVWLYRTNTTTTRVHVIAQGSPL
jgi:hypothetical protein